MAYQTVHTIAKSPKAEKLLCVFEIRKLIALLYHPHLTNLPPFNYQRWSSFSVFSKNKYILHQYKKHAVDFIIMKTTYFNKGMVVTIAKSFKHFPKHKK